MEARHTKMSRRDVSVTKLTSARLANDRRSAKSAATNRRVGLEVVDGLLDSSSPFLLLGFSSDHREFSVRVGINTSLDRPSFESLGRKATDHHSPGNGAETDDNRDGPIATSEGSDLESGSSEVDDNSLTSDHDTQDDEKVRVLEHASEDVEVTIETTTVDHVDCYHKRTKSQRDCDENLNEEENVQICEKTKALNTRVLSSLSSSMRVASS